MIADLQVSGGDKVAKEIGGKTTFVPTDVSNLLSMYIFWEELLNMSIPVLPPTVYKVGGANYMKKLVSRFGSIVCIIQLGVSQPRPNFIPVRVWYRD